MDSSKIGNWRHCKWDRGEEEKSIKTRAVSRQLTQNKAIGEAEFIQNLSRKEMQLVTKLINMTYNTRKILADFLQNIFIPMTKVQKAQ